MERRPGISTPVTTPPAVVNHVKTCYYPKADESKFANHCGEVGGGGFFISPSSPLCLLKGEIISSFTIH